MAKVIIDTANHIAAYAAKAARVQVVAAYPITPQTTVVEKIAEFVESGEMDADYIRVESEHSAMAACVGAEAAGVRAFTATSAHGLALMHEVLHWAAGSRLPIVMAVINRAMGAPWSIWPDYSDSLSQRDTGWLQFYCADNQEVFDTIIQAYKICEDKRVLLPAMVCSEGFILSHTAMPVKIPDQEEIDDFLPPYEPGWVLDVDNPFSHAPLVSPEWYMEFRYMIQEAMENSKKIIEEVDKEYGERFGFRHGGLVDRYRCEDAELVLVTMGTMGAEAKISVDNLRQEGYKVGLARVRAFRPFPKEVFRELAETARMFTAIDRHVSFGFEGFLFSEIKASLYPRQITADPPLISGFLAGIGGRDVTFRDIEKIAKKSWNWMEKGKIEKEIVWWKLRD